MNCVHMCLTMVLYVLAQFGIRPRQTDGKRPESPIHDTTSAVSATTTTTEVSTCETGKKRPGLRDIDELGDSEES